uniref:EF-hand domain-containing protein n=1 Tax=Moschus moschiferus TaxID=68415 RepID=A0A8C6CUS0_MOSMO
MLRGRGCFLPPTVAGQEHEFDNLFEELFRKLGRRGDGMVDIAELQEGLEALGCPRGGEEIILKSVDVNENNLLDLGTFMQYIKDNEINMKLTFKSLDTNNDGLFLIQLLSEEALQIAVKRRKVKSQGEKERYTCLNAEFQRIARRNKKAFLSNQCNEIEEINKMGKTRDLFKKIRDTREHFIKSGHLWKYLLAGGIAGTCARTCTAPLECLKTLVQVCCILFSKFPDTQLTLRVQQPSDISFSFTCILEFCDGDRSANK